MKNVFLLLFFAFNLCNALNQNKEHTKNNIINKPSVTNEENKTVGTNKTIDTIKSIEDSVNSLPPPLFSWTNQYLIHIIFPNQVEDDLHLQAADRVGRILVNCLFNGVLERETGGTAVVSGCINHTVVSVTMYSVNFEAVRMFDWINNNATVEVSNPYLRTNATDPANDYFEEDDVVEDMANFYEDDVAADRVKRGTFEYYDGEEEYVDLDYDGLLPPPPLPSDLILKVKLAFDTGLLEHMNGDEEATKEYVIRVATLGRIHLLHASLGTRIHLQFGDEPVLVPGDALAIDRKSLTYVQSKKEKEAVPLICFIKTDDTDILMGISWPGRRGGACQPDKGAALVKHRNNMNKAAVTFAHEDGHLTGLFHDLDEDRRKLVAGTTCEGTGIMSRGADRPLQFSLCSAKRLRKWFPKHGQCLVTAPSCDNTLQWTTPCTCGTGDLSVGCSSLHVFCSNIQLGALPYQCLTRNDIVLASLTARKSSQDLEQKMMLLEKKVENNEKKVEDGEKKMMLLEKKVQNNEKKVENLEKKSSYCGYRFSWSRDNSYITYQSILLADNVNVPGAEFNKDTGRFTAGTSGTYHVQVSLVMTSYSSYSTSYYNDLYIHKNNVRIAESYLYSLVQTGGYSEEMGGRSMMLHLDLGDTVSLYAESIYNLYHITFCISLE